MTNRTRPSILRTLDAEVATLIATRRNISKMEALRLFWSSETYRMLLDDDLRMWYFSPEALYDIWESEVVTGNPRESVYLRGDYYG